jgi:hypothetical protein
MTKYNKSIITKYNNITRVDFTKINRKTPHYRHVYYK